MVTTSFLSLLNECFVLTVDCSGGNAKTNIIEYVHQRCESQGYKFYRAAWVTFLYITIACFNSGTESFRKGIFKNNIYYSN